MLLCVAFVNAVLLYVEVSCKKQIIRKHHKTQENTTGDPLDACELGVYRVRCTWHMLQTV